MASSAFVVAARGVSHKSVAMDGIEVYSPEILWHGGGNEAGKPDPVFAVDFHPTGVLATAGIDENVPPKGSVRLWKVDSSSMKNVKDNFLLDLSDHQTAVNVCRFSPNGLMLASASDRQIVVYSAKSPSDWEKMSDVRDLERTWLRPSLDEIRDLQWSPDSLFIIAGSIDNKAEILRVETRDSLLIHGHKNYVSCISTLSKTMRGLPIFDSPSMELCITTSLTYSIFIFCFKVQGVAWDPLNTMVVTQSADRSVKMHKLKYKQGAMAKLAPRGHSIAKMHLGYDVPEGSEAPTLSAADFGMNNDNTEGNSKYKSSVPKSKNLYADSTVPSFFRRPCFSPDGNILITPTGIHRSISHPLDDTKASGTSESNARNPALSNSFCTHIYSRDHLVSPIVSLIGLEDPSVSVRCSPILYKLVKSEESEANPSSVIKGDYRMIFAVVTVSAVYIYDTQHPHPLARLGGLHHACINDVAWCSDGKMLVICSSDGYLSFVRFAENSLGDELEISQVPVSVKTALPCLYNFTPLPSVKVEPPPKVVSPGNKESKSNEANTDYMASENVMLSPVLAISSAIESSKEIAEKFSVSKRKRITPNLAGLAGSVSNSSNLSESNNDGSRSCESILNAISSSPSASGVAPFAPPSNDAIQKKKKRITPTIVLASNDENSGNMIPNHL